MPAEKPVTEMTISELKAKIAELQAQIKELQARLAEILPTQKLITYTVAKGETLWSIAKEYLDSGFRWKEITTLDGKTFTAEIAQKLKVGQKLLLPPK